MNTVPLLEVQIALFDRVYRDHFKAIFGKPFPTNLPRFDVEEGQVTHRFSDSNYLNGFFEAFIGRMSLDDVDVAGFERWFVDHHFLVCGEKLTMAYVRRREQPATGYIGCEHMKYGSWSWANGCRNGWDEASRLLSRKTYHRAA